MADRWIRDNKSIMENYEGPSSGAGGLNDHYSRPTEVINRGGGLAG